MPASEQDCTSQWWTPNTQERKEMLTFCSHQVRFNVLRVLPRTGKTVKTFSKF